MSTKASKRGRPRGSSQYAEDREPLERMYALSKRGTRYSKAAKIVVAELQHPLPSPIQAVERLRKKFPAFRAAKDAEAAARSGPRAPQSQQAIGPFTPEELARILDGAKTVREYARWMEQMGLNKDTIKRNAEEARRAFALFKQAGFKIPGSDEGEAG